MAMLLTAGQVSDYKGVAELLNGLPEAKEFLADHGYEANWFREALLDKSITPCIPPKRNRKECIDYEKCYISSGTKSKSWSAE